MTASRTTSDTAGTELVLSTATIERFQEMVILIPDTEGGGVENILASIFDATSAAELEKPWSDMDRGIPLGVPFLANGLTKSASDFRDGLGFYLVVDAIDLRTGESVEWVTGSVSVVAQLVKAYQLGILPQAFKLVEAEKASKAGYKPQHLEVIDNPAPAAKGRGRRG